jgi:predicted kinase
VSRIVLTRGLPASGKSSWAKAWVEADPSTRLRVNRDDIRFQLYGKYWGDGVDEAMVTKVEEAMVKSALDAGKDVVVDATHLASRYVRRWHHFGVTVDIMNFEVPVVELVSRDSARGERGERSVGSDVIMGMVARYHIKPDGKLPRVLLETDHSRGWIAAPEYDPSLTDAIIVDIDGTLANHVGVRSPYDTSRYALDTVHENVARVVNMLQSDGDDGRYMKLILVSGRDAAYRDVTLDWVKREAGVFPDALFMRPEGDRRNDAVVKHELYHEHIANRYNVVGVFDDRGRVLRMWRDIGLTTFAVGDTDNYNF